MRIPPQRRLVQPAARWRARCRTAHEHALEWPDSRPTLLRIQLHESAAPSALALGTCFAFATIRCHVATTSEAAAQAFDKVAAYRTTVEQLTAWDPIGNQAQN